MKFFDDQQKKRDEMRKAVAVGPGAGIELGTAEAAKWTADIVNQRIGAAVVPDRQEAREEDIAKKTTTKESNAKANLAFLAKMEKEYPSVLVERHPDWIEFPLRHTDYSLGMEPISFAETMEHEFERSIAYAKRLKDKNEDPV